MVQQRQVVEAGAGIGVLQAPRPFSELLSLVETEIRLTVISLSPVLFRLQGELSCGVCWKGCASTEHRKAKNVKY